VLPPHGQRCAGRGRKRASHSVNASPLIAQKASEKGRKGETIDSSAPVRINEDYTPKRRQRSLL